AVKAEDFPEAILLDDGGVVAPQFLETVPAAPIPFDEARASVEEAWRKAHLDEALAARAVTIKAAVEGGAHLGAQGIGDRTPEIARNGSIPDAPQELVEAGFDMQPGEIRVVEA